MSVVKELKDLNVTSLVNEANTSSLDTKATARNTSLSDINNNGNLIKNYLGELVDTGLPYIDSRLRPMYINDTQSGGYHKVGGNFSSTPSYFNYENTTAKIMICTRLTIVCKCDRASTWYDDGIFNSTTSGSSTKIRIGISTTFDNIDQEKVLIANNSQIIVGERRSNDKLSSLNTTTIGYTSFPVRCNIVVPPNSKLLVEFTGTWVAADTPIIACDCEVSYVTPVV